MKQIKIFSKISLIAICFILMSFSGGEENLYGTSIPVVFVDSETAAIDQSPRWVWSVAKKAAVAVATGVVFLVSAAVVEVEPQQSGSDTWDWEASCQGGSRPIAGKDYYEQLAMYKEQKMYQLDTKFY